MAKKTIIITIFCLCFLSQIIPVIRSGTSINNGIGFWGPNGHDGIWHLALINNLHYPFKIEMPIFAGEFLKNYHPFFDILLAYVSTLTKINSSVLLFQIFPIISALLYLTLSYKIGQSLTHNTKGGLLLMVLNTINNSFGWIINYTRYRNFEGESLFWSMQSPSNQLNPPFAMSLVLILLITYILLSSKNLNKYQQVVIILVLSVLPVIKAYSAVPAFIIFSLYVIKNKKYYLTLTLSLILAVILFLQYNQNSGSLLIWHPFWFIHSLFESSDKLYLPRFANLAYGSTLKQLIFLLIGIPIFYIGNLGFRILGLKNLLTGNWFYRSLLISICVLSFVPLFFIQSGTSWNTIQFFYYAIFLLNIPFAVYLTNQKLPLITFIIVIQLFPLLYSFPQYLDKNPPAYLSNQEIDCLNFLKSQPKSVVLTYPYNPYIKKELTAPIPLYAYDTTSYVSAFSHQQTFFEDEMNLGNSGYDWQTRRHATEKFFKQENIFQDRGFLLNNKIDYIYLIKSQYNQSQLNIKNLYLTSVFDNDVCQIYHVLK